MSKRDELIQKLGTAIQNDDGLQSEPWKLLVLIAKFHEGLSRLQGIGFLEDGEDVPMAATRNDKTGVLGVLAELRAEMSKVDQTDPWLSCLVKIARPSGEIDIDFEYDEVERWTVSRANREAMLKKLDLKL
ncbi:MAG: hypothetical protein ABWX88_01360 [Pseudoxanthomonas sp.]